MFTMQAHCTDSSVPGNILSNIWCPAVYCEPSYAGIVFRYKRDKVVGGSDGVLPV